MDSRQLNLVLLAANAGLVLTILVTLYWMRDRPTPPLSADRTELVENTITQISVRKFNASNLLAELSRRSLGWSSIESTNYLMYIHNLRGFGCPEETIRDIILTDIAKLYTRQRARLVVAARPFEYWRTVGPGEDALFNPELEEGFAQLDRERDQLVRDLLGVDFTSEINRYLGKVSEADRLYAFLPPEKRLQVVSLLRSLKQMREQIVANSGGILLPSDEEQLRIIDQTRDAELAGLLTPEEYKAYQLTASPLAETLRHELDGFQPSPEEFQSIYNLRHNYDTIIESALAQGELTDPDARERVLSDAEQSLEEEMRKTLGEERYEAYQRATDPDYQFLVKWSDRLQLSGQLADQVYAMKRQAEQQREQIEGNLQLTYEQRQQAYEAIAGETERSLSQLMGDQAFKTYRQAGGQWLKQLGPTEDAFELIVPEIKDALQP